jgi:hypothetical protein
MTNPSPRLLLILGALAIGCGSSVTPGSPDAGVTPADNGSAADNGSPAADAGLPVDARTSCRLPNGGTCLVGQSCPAGDGCNTCSCYGGQETAACTTIGCAVDAGPAPDVRTSCRLPDGGTCLVGQSCPAGDGCNTCSCYGALETAACTTIGCGSRDGGMSDGPAAMDVVSCGGASVAPNGQYCAGPADGPLPLGCCTSWNCDLRAVMCFGFPPTCGAGEVPVAAMGCYGPCVPASNCAPMPCGDGCPTGWTCNTATGNCRRGA